MLLSGKTAREGAVLGRLVLVVVIVVVLLAVADIYFGSGRFAQEVQGMASRAWGTVQQLFR
jgi:hypothetical protein